MSLLVLSSKDVSDIISTLSAQSLIDMMAETLYAISNQPPTSSDDVAPIQNPQRIATETTTHKTLYMPSRLTTLTSGSSTTSIKVVSVPKPNCTIPGLPATTLLMDDTTGKTRAILNASELTGLRTAAASALSTKIFANPKSRNLVIFGTGTQAYYHARLLLELFPSIDSLIFIARKHSQRNDDLLVRLFEELEPNATMEMRLGSRNDMGVRRAVREADIICTCVPSTSSLFASKDLKKGVHLNCIGSYTPQMREFPPNLISPHSLLSQTPNSPDESKEEGEEEVKIPMIVVDSKEACLKESGELIDSKIDPKNVIELGQLFTLDTTSMTKGSVRLRQDVEGKTLLENLRRTTKNVDGDEEGEGRSLFKCVGVGAMDVAVTKLVVEEAERRGLGNVLDF